MICAKDCDSDGLIDAQGKPYLVRNMLTRSQGFSLRRSLRLRLISRRVKSVQHLIPVPWQRMLIKPVYGFWVLIETSDSFS